MAGSVEPRLKVTRQQILAFRRRVGALDERMPMGSKSLRRAAWAGLQDSMPRAALLSLHARIDGVEPSTWEHPSLAQLWGPRYSTYVVPKRDFALFSLGRLPDDAKSRLRAESIAERLHAHLDGRRMTDREAAGALGIGNAIRYAATTGTVAIRWEGARAPTVWTVDALEVDPADACRELGRRYLHIFGPATADGSPGGQGSRDAQRATRSPR
jgi:Winged helix DNA-binding domain